MHSSRAVAATYPPPGAPASRTRLPGCGVPAPLPHLVLSSAALTSAMYLPSGSCAAGDEVPNPEPQRGLVVRTRSGAVVAVRTRPGQVLFQAGLSLQVLSGGLLRATPHAVLAPQNAQHGLTRSTFAVFCNPKYAPHLHSPTPSRCGAGDMLTLALSSIAFVPTAQQSQKLWGRAPGHMHV